MPLPNAPGRLALVPRCLTPTTAGYTRTTKEQLRAVMEALEYWISKNLKAEIRDMQ
jgi:hypothetical protein